MKDRKIDKITNQLASYFGTITKAAFVAEMIDPTYDPTSDFFTPPTPNPEHKAANALLDITEGGKTMSEFLLGLSDYTKPKDGEEVDVDSVKMGMAETFTVTFEPEFDEGGKNWIMNGSPKNKQQGHPTPSKTFSIKKC